MSEQFMKKGNYFEQQMNDNQKDEVICERSKTMKWSASDMANKSSTTAVTFAINITGESTILKNLR
ncbi:hypothetical protein RchiOBHm_Chr6g0270991 [Rosa chinensis]|uniref:Uncharacterized protein n=1 Tax=Rosa chinensis TaxID=74649 RepID=A0A2P6PQU4_ROSCH|nr:hypothetical protein RchiOBHm_Chr6g0270991 [Rosa chinensis]